MKINIVTCDKCGNRCERDYFTVFRCNSKHDTLGKSDICEDCYTKMLKALEKKK